MGAQFVRNIEQRARATRHVNGGLALRLPVQAVRASAAQHALSRWVTELLTGGQNRKDLTSSSLAASTMPIFSNAVCFGGHVITISPAGTSLPALSGPVARFSVLQSACSILAKGAWVLLPMRSHQVAARTLTKISLQTHLVTSCLAQDRLAMSC